MILIQDYVKLTDDDFEYVCELKYDGVSISLTYENGELVQALNKRRWYTRR